LVVIAAVSLGLAIGALAQSLSLSDTRSIAPVQGHTAAAQKRGTRA